jgi:hypothetical protein
MSNAIIRLRRGTEANWTNSDPQPGGEVLKLGEPGYETDTGRLKIGDGINGWNNLNYNFLIAGSGIGVNYNDSLNIVTISNSGVTNVSNFGDNRLLTSNGTSTGINAESNLTYDNQTLSLGSGSINAYGNINGSYFTMWDGNINNSSVTIYNEAAFVIDINSDTLLSLDKDNCHIYSSGLNTIGQFNHDGSMTIDDGLSAPTPIYNLGASSGNTAISYGLDKQIQTLTLNGSSVNFTKGTGWNLANQSVDVLLNMSVTNTTTVAFDSNFVTDWYTSLPVFSSGTYLTLLRSVGSGVVQGHYLGKKL